LPSHSRSAMLAVGPPSTVAPCAWTHHPAADDRDARLPQGRLAHWRERRRERNRGRNAGESALHGTTGGYGSARGVGAPVVELYSPQRGGVATGRADGGGRGGGGGGVGFWGGGPWGRDGGGLGVRGGFQNRRRRDRLRGRQRDRHRAVAGTRRLRRDAPHGARAERRQFAGPYVRRRGSRPLALERQARGPIRGGVTDAPRGWSRSSPPETWSTWSEC